MTQPPTLAQLRNLADRADRARLQPAEVALLREGIDQLEALRNVARGYCPACGRGDAAPTVDDWERERQRAERVRALADRWVKAGPPPLGAPVVRWWDRRLVELNAALDEKDQT